MLVRLGPDSKQLVRFLKVFTDLVREVGFRLAGLNRFSQLLQETEHFCRWRQKKVAKIVPYGLPRYDEGSLESTPEAFLFLRFT
jgi:hypothetical protein